MALQKSYRFDFTVGLGWIHGVIRWVGLG